MPMDILALLNTGMLGGELDELQLQFLGKAGGADHDGRL